MPNFTTRTPVALAIGKPSVSIAAGTVRIPRKTYEAYANIARARRVAQEQVAHLQLQKAQLEEHYRQEGLRAGRFDARAELLKTVAQLQNNMSLWIESTAPHLVALTQECVQKVVRKVDTLAIAQESVEKGLAQFIDAQQIVILAHPEQLESIEEQVAQLTLQWKMGSVVRVQPDVSLNEGDVVVKTAFGEVDLCIDSQIALVQNSLGERL